jgi:magnesium chelatase subunit I
MPLNKPPYPFTAIVGQAALKQALLLSVIDPAIGGVLILGHRGTGKSTAVRSLAALLPTIVRVEGCAYNCDPAAPNPACPHCGHGSELRAAETAVPVIDLPLGATEDRVIGSLDVEKALVDGVQAFAPGLLARANRGFLYIDEVNLLEDHLVDVLLDVAASGTNVVEREGISIRHPARFVLVGSGNPEEGDLRPQLLDRFGLHAQIVTIGDIGQRVEIVKRRRAYDADPSAFCAAWESEQAQLRATIDRAKANLADVVLTDKTIEAAAKLCVALAVDGHRGELTLCRAAVALAALENCGESSADHIRQVAPLALQHRLRKDPLESMEDGDRVRRAVAELLTTSEPVVESIPVPTIMPTVKEPRPVLVLHEPVRMAEVTNGFAYSKIDSADVDALADALDDAWDDEFE